MRGISLVEVLFTVAILATVTAFAVPLTNDAREELRTRSAVRYIEARIMNARMEAVKRSAFVALRFESAATDYVYRTYRDGNGNGVRTLDIELGIDAPLTSGERVGDNFPGVTFGLADRIPDLGGTLDREGVRIGTSRILTMTPMGTATSGTLYLRGRRGQYAIRVLGATGRTRVLQYDVGSRQWAAR